MKTILKFILLDRAWLHILGLLALVYVLRYWGIWAFEVQRYIMTSGALAELAVSPWGAQLIVYVILATFIGIAIEIIEIAVSEGTTFSFKDLIAGQIGATLGFFLFAAIHSQVIFLIALAGFIILTIYFIATSFKQYF